MKASKIIDSLNYLDDDLIIEAENAIDRTPLKKPAKVSSLGRLVKSPFMVAISALIVLLVAGIMYLIINSSSKDYVGKEEGHHNTIVAEGFSEETEALFVDSNQEIDSDSAYSILWISFEGEIYYLSDETFSEKKLQDVKGNVEEASDLDLVGLPVYGYETTETSTVVAVSNDGTFLLFVKEEQ